MLVHQILKNKGTAGVITVPPGTRVAEAAQLLSEKRIGSVVVSAPGSEGCEGVLSERDIVREIGRHGAGCLDEPVERMMTRRIVTCGLEDTAESVLQKMTDGRFRHMPVVEGGRMVGLITIGDVVAARLSELKMEKDALEGMIMGF
jgi:CBS domain-containing protein